MSDFHRKLDVTLWFWGNNLKLSHFTPKFPLKAHFTKFQFECVIHGLANEKSSKPFVFQDKNVRKKLIILDIYPFNIVMKKFLGRFFMIQTLK